jgi:hypothetical protein
MLTIKDAEEQQVQGVVLAEWETRTIVTREQKEMESLHSVPCNVSSQIEFEKPNIIYFTVCRGCQQGIKRVY